MRYVAEHCRLEGAPRAILWALSYRANNDGEFWAGQRRIAKEAGVSRKSVERWMPQFVGMGLLEWVEEGSGPRPDCYRFSAEWVEGVVGGSGVVEGQASGAQVVEGTSEVIHNPEPSGDMVSPLAPEPNFLLATSERPSGDMVSIPDELVATSGNGSGYSQSLSPAETPHKVLIQGSSRSREIQGVRADSTADAVGADAIYTPPEVDEATREHLRRRGLGQKQRPPVARVAPPPPDQPAPARTRDEQLAELRRRNAAEFAEQERQERDGGVHVQVHAGVAQGHGIAHDASVAVDAYAQPATIKVVAGVAQAAVAVTAQARGEQRTAGRTTGHRVDVDGPAAAASAAGAAAAASAAGGELTVVDQGTARDRLRVVNE